MALSKICSRRQIQEHTCLYTLYGILARELPAPIAIAM